MHHESSPDQIPVAQPVHSTSQPQAPSPPTSGRAVATLVLGILSILCMGFFAGVPAIILGSMELRAIKEGTADPSGESITRVGFILGIVGTLLTCLSTLAFIAMIAFGISLGSMEALHQLHSV